MRADEVSEVVLVKLGAVTHGFNQDQRRVRLTATTSADLLTLNVRAPADGRVCPPGHYMLFLMKQNGQQKTPSVARIIRVGSFSTPRAVETFTYAQQTREIDVNGSTDWTVIESDDPDGFISASRTATGKVSVGVTENRLNRRRTGQIRVRLAGKPSSDHVIEVSQAKKFNDITSPSVYQAASKLNAVLVTNGCGDFDFCPNTNVNREQMAAMLVRAILGGAAPPDVSHQTFGDVEPSSWSHDFVEDIARRGITSGCGTVVNGKPGFCPTTDVSRAQLAVFLLRLLNIEPPPPPDPADAAYSDISCHWGYRFIQEAHKQGLTGGCSQAGTACPTQAATTAMFCPDQPATRAEVAEALVKALRL